MQPVIPILREVICNRNNKKCPPERNPGEYVFQSRKYYRQQSQGKINGQRLQNNTRDYETGNVQHQFIAVPFFIIETERKFKNAYYDHEYGQSPDAEIM